MAPMPERYILRSTVANDILHLAECALVGLVESMVVVSYRKNQC